MRFSRRLLSLASLSLIAATAPASAATALVSGTSFGNPDAAPKDVTLPGGALVRIGAHAEISVGPAGELILKKGNAVVVSNDGAPVVVISAGTRTTVEGGTFIVSDPKQSGLRIIAIAGDASVETEGAGSVYLEPGRMVTVFHPKGAEPAKNGPVLTIDLGAIAKSSALLNAAPLPSAEAVRKAAAEQGDAVASGELTPTGKLLVAASRDRGLGFASASDVNNALGQRGTTIKADYSANFAGILAQAAAALNGSGTVYYGSVNIGGVPVPAVVDITTGTVTISNSLGGSTTYTSGGISGGTLHVGIGSGSGGGLTLPGGTILQPVGNGWTLPIESGGTFTFNDGSASVTLDPSLWNPGTYPFLMTGGTLTISFGTLQSSAAVIGLTGSEYKITLGTTATFKVNTQDSVTVKNTAFLAATGATSGIVDLGTLTTDAGVDARVTLDTVTFNPVQTLRASSRTVALSNVTFDQGRLLSRDGVLNIGSVLDGAVNFVSGVRTSDGTDLTTAAGINAKVQVVNGTILQNGAPMAGATGAGAGAPIVIDRHQAVSL